MMFRCRCRSRCNGTLPAAAVLIYFTFAEFKTVLMEWCEYTSPNFQGNNETLTEWLTLVRHLIQFLLVSRWSEQTHARDGKGRQQHFSGRSVTCQSHSTILPSGTTKRSKWTNDQRPSGKSNHWVNCCRSFNDEHELLMFKHLVNWLIML